MILAHSLLRGKVAEHVSLLLIGSSHAHWTRSTLLRSKISDFFRSLLDPKGGNEMISGEKFRRRGSEPDPMKVDQEIYRTPNASCHPMQRIRLRVNCARRGRGGRNLTARIMSARGHALRMIVHSARSHFRCHHVLVALGCHF